MSLLWLKSRCRGWKPGFTLSISSNTRWGKIKLLPWISSYSEPAVHWQMHLELRNNDLESKSLFLVLSVFNITAWTKSAMLFKIYIVSFQIYLITLKSWNVICWCAGLVTGQNSTCLLADEVCYLSEYKQHRPESCPNLVNLLSDNETTERKLVICGSQIQI